MNVRLRRALDLYASLRPVRSLPGVKTRFENVDLVIVRENTEGLYAGIEQRSCRGSWRGLREAMTGIEFPRRPMVSSMGPRGVQRHRPGH